MAQVLCHAVSQCRSISWCKALTFDTPQSNGLNASPMEAQPYFEGWDFEAPQLDFPVVRFFNALLHDRDPPLAGCLMINA